MFTIKWKKLLSYYVIIFFAPGHLCTVNQNEFNTASSITLCLKSSCLIFKRLLNLTVNMMWSLNWLEKKYVCICTHFTLYWWPCLLLMLTVLWNKQIIHQLILEVKKASPGSQTHFNNHTLFYHTCLTESTLNLNVGRGMKMHRKIRRAWQTSSTAFREE